MTFEEVLNATVAMLQRQGRVAYRTLLRQFAVDEAYLEDLKKALLYAHPHVRDDGRGLGGGRPWSPQPHPSPRPLPLAPRPPPAQIPCRIRPSIWPKKSSPPAVPSKANGSR